MCQVSKKKFHQYHLSEDGEWAGGAPTPLPIFGLDTLSNINSEEKVYIFEGEKCTQAAHWLNLPALTSMMGSGQAHKADWAILAGYRHVKHFVLVPDQDEPGRKYMADVFQEIQKACPSAIVSVCAFPIFEKGGDFLEWVFSQSSCPPEWNGYSPIDEPHSEYLRQAFEVHVNKNLTSSTVYFNNSVVLTPTFQDDPQQIEESLSKVLPCPTETLPSQIVKWIRLLAESTGTPDDFFVAPFLVYVGSLIGRKRALNLREGTDWIEFPNLWGMEIGRPSSMKSVAMKAVEGPLSQLAKKATKAHLDASQDYEKSSDEWKLQKSVLQEKYKKDFKKMLEQGGEKTNVSVSGAASPPAEPKMKRYKTNDATVEKLGEILIDNHQGVLLFRDEISGLLNSFEKAGRETDRQFFLESWSGKQDFNVDRIGRGSIYVPALCLSVFGSIQPGPLSRYIRSTI